MTTLRRFEAEPMMIRRVVARRRNKRSNRRRKAVAVLRGANDRIRAVRSHILAAPPTQAEETQCRMT
jgi:hypothetical protein